MKLQARYPFDEFLYGINKCYHTIGADSLFVNSTCVLVYNHVIKQDLCVI